MATAYFNLSQPIVYLNGTMQPPFADFIRQVDIAITAATLVAVWGSVSGTLADQTDLQTALDTKIGATDVTYANLNANGDVGTGATQVSQGDHVHAAADITSGTFADALVAQSNVTQHQAALSITESQISDLQSYILAAGVTYANLNANGDVGTGATQVAQGDHVHAAADVTTGTFADARISATSVTQHVASIDHDSLLNFTATEHFTVGSISIPLTQGANDVTATAAEVNLLDLAALTAGWVLSADTASTASWKAPVYTPPVVANNASTLYTMVAGDANKANRFTGASPAITIPTGTFAVGDELPIRQAGTGTLVLTTTSLTINGTIPGWAQHVEVRFRYVATDEWDVI